jgi:cytochrome c oxidase assembly protein subunit 15
MSDATASPAPPIADRRLPLLRRLAWLCTALMLATISLSAFMRLSQAGLGCADWPACYGQNLRDASQAAQAASGHAVAAARLAHRIVASLTLLLVIVMAMATLATRPVLKRAGALSLALLLLALALAVLGIATPGNRLPAVAMGNLLGGFVMLALCWRLVASTRQQADAAPARLGTWAIAGLILLCGQLAGGALVSASYAALSCSDLADCTRAAAAAGWDWSVLNPWREPVVEATTLPVNAASAFALWAHRVGAIVVLPVLALLGIAAWRRSRRRAGAALIVLAAVQGGLGLLMVASGLPLAAVLLHNLVAALLLATLVRLV